MSTVTRIRVWLVVFAAGLVVSGVTAFPLVTEARLLADLLHAVPAPDALVAWVDRAHEGLAATGRDYPFIAYGTDWLAFAHLVIAIAFWGPWRDPVRNIWVIEWGVICCIGILPLALIAGPIRHLPWWWLMIDMSFGILGIIPLLVIRRLIKQLAEAQQGPTGAEARLDCAVQAAGPVAGASRQAGRRSRGPAAGAVQE